MDLHSYREQIDKVDDELLRLFKDRMEIARKIGFYKKVNNLPIYNSARENEKLAEITQKAGGELNSYARRLFETLFELSRAYQEELSNE